MVRFALVTALLFTAFTTLAGPASAAPALAITGSAPPSAHGRGTVPFTFTLAAGADLDSVLVKTSMDAFIPADASSVKFDSAAVAAASVTRTGGDLMVALGAVATGTHSLTFNALVQATPSVVQSSTMSVSFSTPSGGGATVESAPVTVDLNEPDLVLDSDLNPGVITIGTGQSTQILLPISNAGYGSPSGTVVVDLPAGLTLAPSPKDLPKDIPVCTAVTASRLVCPFEPVARDFGQGVQLEVVTTAAAVPGTDAVITATATPNEGTDQNPANNSVTQKVHYTGAAHLALTITPSKKKVAVGGSAVVTLTVRNDGPQRVDFVVIVIALPESGSHFVVSRFDGNTTPPKLPFAQQAITRFHSAGTTRSPQGGQPPNVLNWFIAPLAVGHTVTAHLTVRATSVGADVVGVGWFSTAADPGCDPNEGCSAALTLTAVPAAAHRTPTPTECPAGDGGHQLANSGLAWAPIPSALLGIGILLLGVGLMLATRWRAPAHR